MRDMYRLQKQAKQIRKDLKNIHVEAEGEGVKVVVSAEMEVVSIEIAPTVTFDRVPAILKDCLNRAFKKAQVVSADRMKGVMEQMGLGAGQGPGQAMGM